MRFAAISLLSSALYAVTTTISSAQAPEDSASSKSVSWSLLPIIFSSPDTDWGFGVLPQMVFQLPETERLSRAFIAAYYTLNNQYAVSSAGSFWFDGGRANSEFEAETRVWPTDFYGLSARDTDVRGVSYTERISGVALRGSRRVGPQLRLGLDVQMQWMDIEWTDDDSLGQPITVTGHEGGWLVALGPSLGIDSRDHVFFPTGGWLINLSTSISGYSIGGDYDFLTAQLDVRTYRRMPKHHVLAAQAILIFNSAGVPFWRMPGVGSAIRGYQSMQFLDRQLAAAQVEYRIVPFVWRIGLTGFVGVGSVGDSIDSLTGSRVRWAAGLGLRFVFMRSEKINIRWDFGFGPGSSGDYLDITEAY